MAKLNLLNLQVRVNDKITEIDRGIESLMRSDVSESTKRTQKYQKSKQMHDLIVVRELIDALYYAQGEEWDVGDLTNKYIESMVTLTEERKAKYTIEVYEGANVMELMEKYKDVKDVYHKMMKAAEEAGLKADFAKGIFVKA